MTEAELYIHVPFCVKKCVYCDFLSFPKAGECYHGYVEALCREIRQLTQTDDAYAAYTRTLPIRSVFFGGGTPSLLSGDDLSLVMKALRESFTIRGNAEITIEANPGTFDREKALMWRALGINRLSVGVQSLNDRELGFIGRIHTAEEAKKQILLLDELGFSNISADIMFGLPYQTEESLNNTLSELKKLPLKHVSAYSLIVEPGTEMERVYGENPALFPDEDTERNAYALIRRELQAAGFIQYEISNFAKPGYESLHNLGYWERVPYFGLGLGASSLLFDGEGGELRYKNDDDLEDYINNPGATRREEEYLTLEDAMEEYMFLGLRKTAGIHIDDFEKTFDVSFASLYAETTETRIEEGLLARDGDRLYLTERGMDLANYVFASYLLDRD